MKPSEKKLCTCAYCTQLRKYRIGLHAIEMQKRIGARIIVKNGCAHIIPNGYTED